MAETDEISQNVSQLSFYARNALAGGGLVTQAAWLLTAMVLAHNIPQYPGFSSSNM